MENSDASQSHLIEHPEVLEYWSIVRLNRRIVIGATLVAVCGAFFHFSKIPNSYEASAQILVQGAENVMPGPQLGTKGGGESQYSTMSDYDYYANQIAIMNSTEIKEKVKKGLAGLAPGYTFRATHTRNTSILVISVTCADPEWAALIANMYAEVMIRESANEQLFITEQILSKYIPEDLEPEVSAKKRRSLLKETAADPRGVAFNKALFAESLTTITEDPMVEELRAAKVKHKSELDAMSQRYGSEHPDLIEAKRRLDETEKALKDRTQTLLNNLRASLAGEIQIASMRVLEPATTPTGPSAPDRPRGIFMTGVVALLASMVIVIIIERLNQKVITQKDLKEVTLAFLGYIPFVKSLNVNKRADLSELDWLTNIMEKDTLLADAVVNVRTHILFSIPYEKSKRILIASSLPDEGKTTLSILLSISFCALGRKILLIDADMRKPAVEKYLNLKKTVGLSDYLLGVASIEDVTQTIPSSGLKVITAGSTNAPHVPELLGGDAFRKLLDFGTQNYDRVIVDVPPLLHIPDGLIVAETVPTGVIVCGSNMVHKKTLNMIKEKFDHTRFTIIGAVINRANYEKEDYYHKKYYKGYKDYGQPPAANGSTRTKRLGFYDRLTGKSSKKSS